MNTKADKRKWTGPGSSEPTLFFLLGWILFYGDLIALLFANLTEGGGVFFLYYTTIAGIIVIISACKTKSFVMLIAGIVEFFGYILVEMISGFGG